MRISDWSSDVCSSDLRRTAPLRPRPRRPPPHDRAFARRARARECGYPRPRRRRRQRDEGDGRSASRLALHFLDTEERIRTAAEIRKRLEPGAPFVAAHGSFPQEAGTRDRWLDRYAAFAIASGGDPDPVAKGRQAVATHVAMLTPAANEELPRAAGFTGVEQFYAPFTWRSAEHTSELQSL